MLSVETHVSAECGDACQGYHFRVILDLLRNKDDASLCVLFQPPKVLIILCGYLLPLSSKSGTMTRMSSTNFQLLLRSRYFPITAASAVGPHKRRKCVGSLRSSSWTKRAGQPVSMPRSQSRERSRGRRAMPTPFFSFFFLWQHIPNAGPKCWACSMLREKKAACDSAPSLKVVCVRKRSLLKLPPLRFVHVRALIGKTRV